MFNNNSKMAMLAAPLSCAILVGCGSDSNSEPSDDETIEYRDISQPISFNFNTGEQGFVALFSDYPQGQEEFYELDASYQAFPSPLEHEKGFRLYGSNRSDDLFMGVYGKLDNLEPAKNYAVTLSATIITNTPSNCIGIGGAPGESVYIKVATESNEPTNYLDGDMYRLEWDIGAQSQRGEHSQVVGDISNGIDCMEQPRYVEKNMVAEQSIPVIANDKGEIWLLIGSDSGFEGPSELLIKEFTVSFSQ